MRHLFRKLCVCVCALSVVDCGMSVRGVVRCCFRWHVPPNAWYALVYWILCTSIACYILLTWANQHADASMVLAYTPVQPATSALLSFFIIQTGLSTELEEPGYNALGIIGIFLGLGLVIYDYRRTQQQKLPYSNVPNFDTFGVKEDFNDRECKGEEYIGVSHQISD